MLGAAIRSGTSFGFYVLYWFSVCLISPVVGFGCMVRLLSVGLVGLIGYPVVVVCVSFGVSVFWFLSGCVELYGLTFNSVVFVVFICVISLTCIFICGAVCFRFSSGFGGIWLFYWLWMLLCNLVLSCWCLFLFYAVTCCLVNYGAGFVCCWVCLLLVILLVCVVCASITSFGWLDCCMILCCLARLGWVLLGVAGGLVVCLPLVLYGCCGMCFGNAVLLFDLLVFWFAGLAC